MRVVVIGATGNVGSATVRALEADPRIAAVIGVARRLPPQPNSDPTQRDPAESKVTWRATDISSDDLSFVAGADAVVHLAWKIQPSRVAQTMRETNVHGTRRVLEAVATQRVPALIYASSVGTYAPGPKLPPVDESWPATGISTSTYSRHKAEVEAMLDVFEAAHPEVRIVRMRTSLVFQRAAAAEIHRLFLGSLVPWHLPRAMRLIPSSRRLTFQATHADDVADAYLRAVVTPVTGAFNIAAQPTLTPGIIATAVRGRVVPLPIRVARAAMRLSYAARLQPSEAGWLDMALHTPIMNVDRAGAELGWSATTSSSEALVELLNGIGDGAGGGTVPLHPRSDAARERDPNG